MDIFDLLCMFAIVGGSVYGTAFLMKMLAVPAPVSWIVPLVVFALVGLVCIRYLWRVFK